MKKTYVFANLFWIALAVFVGRESWQYNVGGLHTPGPGFLPFYTALLLGILSLIALVQTLKGGDGPASAIWGKMNFRKLGITLAALFLYTILLDKIGFVTGTFLLLLLLFRVVEPYKWTSVLLLSFFTITGTYLFFVVLLESRLPRGFLNF
jgi:putative tricarboxylic transport membrane protein